MLRRFAGGAGRISLWGALVYGIISPTYTFSRTLVSVNKFVETTREVLELEPPDAHPRSLYWLMSYAADQQGNEQATIRRFRSGLEDTLKVECNTNEGKEYQLPELVRVGKGRYELQMECNGKTLIAVLGEVKIH